ncbi:hypothetical protein VNO78_25658 [Psophocarpus tetragonolobus]|uniref:Leucine-rich repeat-containing N-terminal plant-type domain-containing protein n=1 Tax=Psophocarpus tetragonolobus TaxID=3891 RepID=A0AAN9S6U7_PSOTE
MCLFWLYLCNHVFVVSGQCLDDQKSLLLQFKNNLSFTDKKDRSFNKLDSWNASNDCCKHWEGVRCDKKGHVTYLYLAAKSISVGFDNVSVVFSLGHLQILDLSNNYLTGPMTSLVMVKNLTCLNLSNNNLNGTISSSHFEGLHNLDIIDLSYNSFTGIIPSSLFTLPSLRVISLSENSFTQWDEIVNLTSFKLEILDISINNLSGRIPSYLFTLPLLLGIELSYNQFSQLDEFINVSSSKLDTLDLEGNKLIGPFPKFIFKLCALSTLKLSSNRFNGLVQLNKFFELKNLTELDLSYNNLSVNVNGITFDPSSIPSISLLYLASCNLKTFPDFLRNLSKIRDLDLSHNQIQGIIPNWIWQFDYLLFLNISHNLLTKFQGPLQNLASNIRYLDFHHNKLQGPIPVFDNSLYLDFSSNKFSTSIPQDIGNYLSQTYFLSLSNNTLHGNIPDSLCDASLLQVLDLSINKISGIIPSCLMMVSCIEVLNMKNNNLSGSIPDTIPTSCRLWSLNLHGNALDGLVPKSLAYCSKLKVLDLGSNQITGGFPCFLNQISTLRILVLRNNKFVGTLRCPEANKTWEMLQIVDIAFNNFSGKLPEKYFTTWTRNVTNNEDGDGSMFIELSMYDGGKYFQDGVIVRSKGQQMELVKILKIFTSIDFSSNHFEGPIPKELMEYKALHVLNLSNNALSGEIPSSISNLRELESMDLSQNNLSGEIPVQLATLSFLSYLNLSYNRLVGKIPTGTQLQSFPASSFEGNDGLFGPPLTEKHDDKEPMMLSKSKSERVALTTNWNFISVELGLVFGHAILFGSLFIWKQWRVWYWQLIHKILCWIFPQLYLEYVTQRGQTYVTLRWHH